MNVSERPGRAAAIPDAKIDLPTPRDARPANSPMGGTAMSENESFQEGYDAYWDGIDPDDNPYPPEAADRLSWDEGWSQAQLEDDDELEE
jgi:hypothetical protein